MDREEMRKKTTKWTLNMTHNDVIDPKRKYRSPYELCCCYYYTSTVRPLSSRALADLSCRRWHYRIHRKRSSSIVRYPTDTLIALFCLLCSILGGTLDVSQPINVIGDLESSVPLKVEVTVTDITRSAFSVGGTIAIPSSLTLPPCTEVNSPPQVVSLFRTRASSSL